MSAAHIISTRAAAPEQRQNEAVSLNLSLCHNIFTKRWDDGAIYIIWYLYFHLSRHLHQRSNSVHPDSALCLALCSAALLVIFRFSLSPKITFTCIAAVISLSLFKENRRWCDAAVLRKINEKLKGPCKPICGAQQWFESNANHSQLTCRVNNVNAHVLIFRRLKCSPWYFWAH